MALISQTIDRVHIPKSIELLKSRCKKVLGAQNVVFLYSGVDLIWPKARVVDVVLLGGPFRQLADETFWIRQLPVRIWVLSQANKKILTTLVGFGENEVSVLPRHLLATQTPLGRNVKHPFETECHLVMSTRLVPAKNYQFAFAIANRLQHLSNQKVQFSLCGPVIDPRLFQAEVDKYEWKYAPRILGGDGNLGSSWTSKINGNPVLLNLSTSYEEDFALSTEQAARKNWPLILSHWGAHLDVRASSLQFVDCKFVFQSQPGQRALELAAGKIAKRILKNEFVRAQHARTKLVAPRVLNYQDIEAKLTSLKPEAVSSMDQLFSDNRRDKIVARRWKKKINAIMSGGVE